MRSIITAVLLIGFSFFSLGCEKRDRIRHHYLTPQQQEVEDDETNTGLVILAGQSNLAHLKEIGDHHFLKYLGVAGEYEVINCARNGTYLWEWRSGGTLWQTCLDQAQGKNIAAIFFYQGEQDAIDMKYHKHIPSDPENYGRDLMSTFGAYRGMINKPNLPIVFAQIARSEMPEHEYWETIKSQQATVNQPNTTMIKTDDLPLEDGLHIDPSAWDTLAARFVKAFIEVRR